MKEKALEIEQFFFQCGLVSSKVFFYSTLDIGVFEWKLKYLQVSVSSWLFEVKRPPLLENGQGAEGKMSPC